MLPPRKTERFSSRLLTVFDGNIHPLRKGKIGVYMERNIYGTKSRKNINEI